jgi:hypothetical protein
MDSKIYYAYIAYFYISICLLLLIYFGFIYNNNNIISNISNIFNNSKFNNPAIFLTLNYNINSDNNKYIIDRSKNDEFKYILNKVKSNIKLYYTNVVLITSKIIVSRNIFSYIFKRSIYSIEERFKQTLDTIKSIRKYIPDACIILIDDSNFENGYIYINTELNNLCDIFINPLNDKDLHYYTNVNKYKSIAEGYQIMYFLDIFNNLNIKFKNFFKISGRYYINDTFNYNNYTDNNIIFSYDKKLDFIYYYTSFYMIPYSKFDLYVNAYKVLYNNKNNEDLIGNNIEYILPHLIELKNIKVLNNLGITQRIAVKNEISNI